MKRIKHILLRKNMVMVGTLAVFIMVLMISVIINTTQLSDRSRASGTNFDSALNYNDRVQQITRLCSDVKGYMARTELVEGMVLFDRFSGLYYSLDRKNPVVTPLPDQPDTAYCGTNGVPEKNWCDVIVSETACQADCTWIETCGKCAPLGVDPGIICPE